VAFSVIVHRELSITTVTWVEIDLNENEVRTSIAFTI